MLDKLRAEYKEAQAKLARREQLRVMLTDAAAQLNEISARERTLYEQLQKENANVDVMERTTVTSVFYTLLGKKEEKLEKEQREAQAAKLAYQAVTRELADCRDRIDAMTRERDALTEYIERCVALREQIREELRGDPATAEQILALERELTENRTQLREIDVVMLARYANGAVRRLREGVAPNRREGFVETFGILMVAGCVDDRQGA